MRALTIPGELLTRVSACLGATISHAHLDPPQPLLLHAHAEMARECVAELQAAYDQQNSDQTPKDGVVAQGGTQYLGAQPAPTPVPVVHSTR